VAWFIVVLISMTTASPVPGEHCGNSSKAMADTVLTIQELSGDFGGLLPMMAESSEYKTWRSHYIPQPLLFHRAVHYWAESERTEN
jgi:hypothetical protein